MRETSKQVQVRQHAGGVGLAAGRQLRHCQLPRARRGAADLARAGLRFGKRQPGSGTRFLLDCLLEEAGVDTRDIAGYEQGEYTHAAVAAYVASGMADVGFGVETPARRFKLDFLPVDRERYFLLCHEAALSRPRLQALLQVLRSADYQRGVGELPGYAPWRCGEVETLARAFPKPARERPAAARRR
jgi:molybdate-binding protein